jgi:hypothetical protein
MRLYVCEEKVYIVDDKIPIVLDANALINDTFKIIDIQKYKTDAFFTNKDLIHRIFIYYIRKLISPAPKFEQLQFVKCAYHVVHNMLCIELLIEINPFIHLIMLVDDIQDKHIIVDGIFD